MKFLNYTQHHVTQADKDAVMAVLDSDRLTQGPTVELVEAKLCEMTGAKYCVVVNSGTAALHLMYEACVPPHNLRIPAITFRATRSAALQAGYEPVVIDVDHITGRTQAVDVYVSLGGCPPEGPTPRLVDGCHGPLKHMGGQATAFSFHPAKHCAAGEGGAVVTDVESIADDMRGARSHVGYPYGFNYRMPEMSAALLLSQLDRYQQSVTIRRYIAARYDEAFAGKVETVPHNEGSARHLYQLLVPLRGFVQRQLTDKGVGTQVHYQPLAELPNARWHADHTLSIPMFPTMTTEQVDHVIKSVLEVV